MSAKKALITGITGQDGSYLTELLLEKGYEVHGLVRRTSTLERSRLRQLYMDEKIYGVGLHLHYADLSDPTTVRRLLRKIAPDEVYHLAGQSHVGLSFEMPESTCEMTAMATLRLLEILRDLEPMPKFFHASSSEIFGRPKTWPQDEDTPAAPISPYGVAKAFATQMVTLYRESFHLHACNGIMYNHESPRRGENFVTRKICHGAALIKLGLEKELRMGDMSAQRDWGYAPDYVRGMWLAVQQPASADYVFATGELHSVQRVTEIAFAALGLDWSKYCFRDERFMRISEPHHLVGNAAKARTRLGWEHSKTFEQMIEEMTLSELQTLSKERGS